jgi:hypothetical protein
MTTSTVEWRRINAEMAADYADTIHPGIPLRGKSDGNASSVDISFASPSAQRGSAMYLQYLIPVSYAHRRHQTSCLYSAAPGTGLTTAGM